NARAARPARVRQPDGARPPGARLSGRRRRGRSGRPAVSLHRPASASPLTPRTEERRPVAQDDPLDRRPADPARLAFAAVDLEERLEAAGLARRVAVIPERRAPDPDRGLEDVADRVPEPRRLVGAERVRGAVRPDPGAEERLVRVDVAD